MAFTIFDKDSSSCISVEEVLAVMKSLGIYATEEEVAGMIKKFDIDGTVFKVQYVKMVPVDEDDVVRIPTWSDEIY